LLPASVAGVRKGKKKTPTYPTTTTTGHIQSHSDEDDGERLKFLLAKGEEHRLWVLRKYDKPDPYK
jgi:hypothetical protein